MTFSWYVACGFNLNYIVRDGSTDVAVEILNKLFGSRLNILV